MREPDHDANRLSRAPDPAGAGSPRERPNAFSSALLARLRDRDPAPAVPEAENAGPWRVTRLHGAGAPLWATRGAGEPEPRFELHEADVAYLVATGLATADRPTRFRFEEAEGDGLQLVHDGRPVGRARRRSDQLPVVLTALDHLRARPVALAHLLLAVPDEILTRAGEIVMDLLQDGRS